MDIDIFDNYSGQYPKIDLSKYEKGFLTDSSLYVIICHSGSGKYQFHLHEINIEKGGMMIIPPNVPFHPICHGGDFELDAIRIGNSHFEVVDDITVRPQFEHLLSGVPVLHLDELRMRMGHIILLYINKLKSEYAIAGEEQKKYILQIIEGYLRVLLLEICNLVSMQDSSLKSYMKQDVTTQRFFKSLAKNYKTREKVSFYSSQIGVSPKKLAHTIFKHTGKNPSEWIDDFTLIEAKKMIRTMDMTIQEISYDLNFATPSHFTKFFKKKTGMTPSEYRESKDSYK